MTTEQETSLNEDGRPGDQMSGEDVRAIEAELEKVTIDEVLLQTVVSLLNLGARKTGMAAAKSESGAEHPLGGKADFEQVRMAIEGVRALLPLLEPLYHDKLGPIRDSLSRLQFVYTQNIGKAESGEHVESQKETKAAANQVKGDEKAPRSADGDIGPAQQSGRLWVPGGSKKS